MNDLGPRSLALALGCPTYTGKVCSKHPELDGERYTSDRKCVRCQRERSRQYYAKNREACLEYDRQWRAKNREACLEYDRRYRTENAEVRRRYSRQWYRRNRWKSAQYSACRRSREAQAKPLWLTPADYAAMKAIVQTSRALGLEVDHIDPLKPCACGRWGYHEPDNLQLLTKAQNRSKGARCMSCWIASGALLAREVERSAYEWLHA